MNIFITHSFEILTSTNSAISHCYLKFQVHKGLHIKQNQISNPNIYGPNDSIFLIRLNKTFVLCKASTVRISIACYDQNVWTYNTCICYEVKIFCCSLIEKQSRYCFKWNLSHSSLFKSSKKKIVTTNCLFNPNWM